MGRRKPEIERGDTRNAREKDRNGTKELETELLQPELAL